MHEPARNQRMLCRLSILVCAFLAAGYLGAEPDWPALEREARSILSDFVKIDTTNPPADVSKAVEFLEGILDKEGIPTRRYAAAAEGKINLLARLPGKENGKPVLMLAHMDVVPADPAHWRHPPFGALLINGELWGRGTLDMKGQAVIQMLSMIALKREGIIPGRELLMLFTCDEETGGEKGAGWMVQNAYADLDPEYVLDEGLSGSTDIYTDDGRTVFAVAVDEKRVLWLKLIARGDDGHGSMPGPRVAAERLGMAIARLGRLAPKPRTVPALSEMRRRLGGLPDNRMMRALGRTTLTVTALRAGVGDPPSVNVIPAEAYALVDCRLLPGDSAEKMIRSIRKAIADFEVELEIIHRPAETPPVDYRSGLYDAIERAVAAHVPGAITVPALLAAGTDSRYFRERGAKAYGFEPFVRSSEEEALIHGDNERIGIAELNRALRIYYGLLRDFLD